MKPVTELDIETLERYLDDDLSATEAEQLRRRLASEPELAMVMAEMRWHRSARLSVYRSLEPDDAWAGRFAASVRSSAHRLALWDKFRRVGRVAAAAAACVVIGFLAGWVGRGRAVAAAAPSGGHSRQDSHIAVVTSDHDQNADRKGDTEVAGRDAGRSIDNADIEVVARGGTPAEGAEVETFQVVLTDLAGNVMAVQDFSDPEEARRFANDYGRWQATLEQMQQGQVVRITEKF